jgi:hypothetical protein
MICAVKLVHLLSAFRVREGRATAQQEVGNVGSAEHGRTI